MSDMKKVTIAELTDKFPGIQDDIENVSQWLGCSVSNLSFTLDIEPMANRAAFATDLLSTYPCFPRDERRTNAVRKALKCGSTAWPIFVDAVDGFLMEGRHRIVAFYLEGRQTVNVVRVKANEVVKS